MEMNRKYNPFCGRAFFFEWGAKNLFKKKRQNDCDPGIPFLNEKGTAFL
jgi:hypothetical protein